MSSPVQVRKSIPARDRARILNKQGQLCFYCSRPFGVLIRRANGKVTTLKLHWDHALPYAYSQNNDADNYVAACHLCNLWKRDQVFKTADEARIWLAAKWGQELIGEG